MWPPEEQRVSVNSANEGKAPEAMSWHSPWIPLTDLKTTKQNYTDFLGKIKWPPC